MKGCCGDQNTTKFSSVFLILFAHLITLTQLSEAYTEGSGLSVLDSFKEKYCLLSFPEDVEFIKF